MAETLTANYSWTKPDPGASANTWGNTLNGDFDKIDAQVFANQQAAVANAAPIGSITMFGGATPPTGWLICDGSSLSTTGTYAGLFAIIGARFNQTGDPAGVFRLPNLQGAFPLGAGSTYALASTGGAATVTLDATMIPAHTHTASQAAHTHTASQAAHAHAVATGGHSHTITTGSHSHTLTGGNIVVAGSGLTPGGSAFALGGATISTAGNLGGNTDTAGNLGGGTDAQTPAITLSGPVAPAITVAANTGGGAAHPNMPPFLGVNFIIRFT